MISKEHKKELAKIEERGKMASDLRIESYKLENELNGIEKGIREINKINNFSCYNGKLNFNFSCIDNEFAATKIKEILEHELILCKRNIKQLDVKIGSLINGD